LLIAGYFFIKLQTYIKYIPKNNMKIINSTREFLKQESASGIVMIFFALLAIILANSPLNQYYQNFINYSLKSETFETMKLKQFTKDILMVFFFFLIGLELKREACEGFLKEKSQILLPLLAAIFGMAVPAAIFYLFNYQIPELLHGWAIPSATDIAFAVCILLLVTKNFPNSAKVFLLAVAIFDDLGAILIIAFFYSTGVKILALVIAGLLVVTLFLLHKFKIKLLTPYMIFGGLLAYFLHSAGVHTTIAGVITALAIPFTDNNGNSPLKHFLHKFHYPVNFLILPLFAFVSAGVSFYGLSMEQIFASVPLGIACGLFFGKQIGIFGISFLAIKFGIAKKPEGASWIDIYIVSIIAGIGFTMSLFVGMLAYSDPILQEEVKFGVLVGSIASTIFALLVAKLAKR
jgi:NhaA family Na+:H+ antiporter